MKNILFYGVVIFSALIAGTIGKVLTKEFLFQNEINNAIKECVSLGQNEEVCKKIGQYDAQNLKNARNQTTEEREKTIRDGNKNAFITACAQQGTTTKYCECGYQKVIDKYGYDKYEELKSNLGRLGKEGLQSDPELKALSEYMTIEVPNVCPR